MTTRISQENMVRQQLSLESLKCYCNTNNTIKKDTASYTFSFSDVSSGSEGKVQRMLLGS